MKANSELELVLPINLCQLGTTPLNVFHRLSTCLSCLSGTCFQQDQRITNIFLRICPRDILNLAIQLTQASFRLGRIVSTWL